MPPRTLHTRVRGSWRGVLGHGHDSRRSAPEGFLLCQAIRLQVLEGFQWSGQIDLFATINYDLMILTLESTYRTTSAQPATPQHAVSGMLADDRSTFRVASLPARCRLILLGSASSTTTALEARGLSHSDDVQTAVVIQDSARSCGCISRFPSNTGQAMFSGSSDAVTWVTTYRGAR